ncbi:MAG: serine hydrolase, partial [Deltaproteobacteria bacterium]|nr:serine hydrolase [Deltaproteobacteria bacterium]
MRSAREGSHRRPRAHRADDRSDGSRTGSNSRGNRGARPDSGSVRWEAAWDEADPSSWPARCAGAAGTRRGGHDSLLRAGPFQATITRVSCRIVTRCRVPSSLTSVTTIRPNVETPPRDVGVDPAAVDRIWEAAEEIYRSGIHPALALCVRHRGEVLLDRALGHAHGNGPYDRPEGPKVLATPDTPFGMMSATKAVTAMVVHLLDERNLLRIDDRVC